MIDFLLGIFLLHSSAQAPWVTETKPMTALEAPFIPFVPIETTKIDDTAILKATTTEDSLISAIATCESNNDPKAKNKHSTASGRFQFLKGTWEYYGKKLWGDDWIKKDVFSYEDNTELATWVINTYGTHDWDESKFCWYNK